MVTLILEINAFICGVDVANAINNIRKKKLKSYYNHNLKIPQKVYYSLKGFQ